MQDIKTNDTAAHGSVHRALIITNIHEPSFSILSKNFMLFFKTHHENLHTNHCLLRPWYDVLDLEIKCIFLYLLNGYFHVWTGGFTSHFISYIIIIIIYCHNSQYKDLQNDLQYLTLGCVNIGQFQKFKDIAQKKYRM